jgi:hypothetical protein
MEGHELIPCTVELAWMHIVIAGLSSVTTVLVTWLTVRARKRDVKEAHDNGNMRQPKS